MTNKEKIDMLCRLRSDIAVFIPRLKHQYCNTLNEIIEELEQIESSSEKPNKSEIPTDWIPIKTRPMTEEEKEENVLDKIRAEIAELEEGISSYHNDRPLVFKNEVLQIIDKYKKTESEK